MNSDVPYELAVRTSLMSLHGKRSWLKKKQLLHLNVINMRLYGAEDNNIERGEVEVNIVVLCSIKPHIDQVHVR